MIPLPALFRRRLVKPIVIDRIGREPLPLAAMADWLGPSFPRP